MQKYIFAKVVLLYIFWLSLFFALDLLAIAIFHLAITILTLLLPLEFLSSIGKRTLILENNEEKRTYACNFKHFANVACQKLQHYFLSLF